MAGLGDTVQLRTSSTLENGRVPPAVEGAPRAFGGLGPDIPGSRPVRYVVGGIAKNGPEDRGPQSDASWALTRDHRLQPFRQQHADRSESGHRRDIHGDDS